MAPVLNQHIEEIKILCKKHFVKNFYVFGSSVNNNFSDESDIDFLYSINLEVFLDWDKGHYDYSDNLFELEHELELLLKRKIDLIPADIIIKNKYLQRSIDESKTLIYAE